MKTRLLLIITVLLLLNFACSLGASAPTPTPDLAATMEVAIEQTMAAQPTATATVTSTLTPTVTKTPEPTNTPTKTATPTPTEEEKPFSVETLENEWSQFTYQEAGFVISIPPAWEHLDLSSGDFDQMLDEVGDNRDTPMAELLSSDYLRTMIAAGMQFMAVDSSVTSLSAGVPTSINILSTEMPISISLDDMTEILASQLQTMFGDDLELQHEIVEINGVEALRLVYQQEAVNPFGQTHLLGLQQYVIIQDDIQYVITLGTVAELYEQNSEIFTAIAQSFVILP